MMTTKDFVNFKVHPGADHNWGIVTTTRAMHVSDCGGRGGYSGQNNGSRGCGGCNGQNIHHNIINNNKAHQWQHLLLKDEKVEHTYY